MKESTPSIARLKECFEVEASTGHLYWRVTRSNRVKAGKRAGVLDARSKYRRVGLDGRLLMEHRVVYALIHGAWPLQVDHINRVRDDNRPENLRASNFVHNRHNRALQKNNKTGWLGVVTLKNGKFEARSAAGGKLRRFGRFSTAAEAGAAYLANITRLEDVCAKKP